MANDLEIIKQLEKEIGGKLRMVGLEKISDYSISGAYAVDEKNRVIGLNLIQKELSKIPQTILELSHLNVLNVWHNKIKNISPIKALQNLTQLDLSSNQISDISVLKELSNLTQLDLMNNQISDISVLKDLSNLKGKRGQARYEECDKSGLLATCLKPFLFSPFFGIIPHR